MDVEKARDEIKDHIDRRLVTDKPLLLLPNYPEGSEMNTVRTLADKFPIPNFNDIRSYAPSPLTGGSPMYKSPFPMATNPFVNHLGKNESELFIWV